LFRSRGEQDSNFWKEVVTALVDTKNNMETSRNGYPIRMFQGDVKMEEGGLDLFSFIFIFIFIFYLFFYFLFLEQLGLGLIGHAVTSVTT